MGGQPVARTSHTGLRRSYNAVSLHGSSLSCVPLSPSVPMRCRDRCQRRFQVRASARGADPDTDSGPVGSGRCPCLSRGQDQRRDCPDVSRLLGLGPAAEGLSLEAQRLRAEDLGTTWRSVRAWRPAGRQPMEAMDASAFSRRERSRDRRLGAPSAGGTRQAQ